MPNLREAGGAEQAGRLEHPVCLPEHGLDLFDGQQIEDVVRHEAIAGGRRFVARRPALGQPHLGARRPRLQPRMREPDHPGAQIDAAVARAGRQLLVEQPLREAARSAAKLEDGTCGREVAVLKEPARRDVLVERLRVLEPSDPVVGSSGLGVGQAGRGHCGLPAAGPPPLTGATRWAASAELITGCTSKPARSRHWATHCSRSAGFSVSITWTQYRSVASTQLAT